MAWERRKGFQSKRAQLHFLVYTVRVALEVYGKFLRVVVITSSLLLLATLVLPQQPFVPTSPRPPVLLISIDGMSPAYVLEADKYRLKVPHLRRLMREGSYATAVTGVFPTVTYPSHTTMLTGVAPSKHGVLANTPFDPFGHNRGGWYWYAEDVKVPTLWEVTRRAGLVTSSVHWPVTVGAPITYNLVQYWRAGTPDDRKLIRALSTPGLLDQAEGELGPYPIDKGETVAGDRRLALFNVYLLEKKKPRFHTAYFTGLDTEQHASGPYSAQALAALEEIDILVGQVRGGG
jgi:predicted AlkP superfamily pyrophosphatase or phosphodiesterase